MQTFKETLDRPSPRAPVRGFRLLSRMVADLEEGCVHRRLHATAAPPTVEAKGKTGAASVAAQVLVKAATFGREDQANRVEVDEQLDRLSRLLGQKDGDIVLS